MVVSRRSLLKGVAATPVVLSPALLSACADRGSSSTSGTLSIGQISNSVAFFPLFIAENQGYFKDEGLKLGDRPRLGTGAKVAAALKSGSIDVGGGVITDAYNLAATDSGMQVLTSLVSQYYVDIVVGTSFKAPATGAGLDEKVNALVGKRIGITGPGSGTEALVTYLYASVGKDPKKDATLVNLGSAATSAVGALKAKRVDALAFFQPIGQIAEATKVGDIYISPAAGDIPSLAGALHGVTFSTKSITASKKDEVASFRTAIKRSLELVHGDESKVRELLGEYLKGTPPAALDAIVPILRKEMPTSPLIDETAYDVAREFHLDSGLVAKAPTYDQAVPQLAR